MYKVLVSIKSVKHDWKPYLFYYTTQDVSSKVNMY